MTDGAIVAHKPPYARFRLTYPSGMVIDYYTDGSMLREVQVLRPMANVKSVDTCVAPRMGTAPTITRAAGASTPTRESGAIGRTMGRPKGRAAPLPFGNPVAKVPAGRPRGVDLIALWVSRLGLGQEPRGIRAAHRGLQRP